MAPPAHNISPQILRHTTTTTATVKFTLIGRLTAGFSNICSVGCIIIIKIIHNTSLYVNINV